MPVDRQHILELLALAEGRITLPVCSNSMSPAIDVDELIVVQASSIVEYSIGDVVLFLRGDQVVVHRVVKKQVEGAEVLFCEKGDNACSWTWIGHDRIVGRIVGVLDVNKREKWPDRQLTSINRIRGRLGWAQVSITEAITRFAALLPAGVRVRFRRRSIGFMVRGTNRCLLLLGTIICGLQVKCVGRGPVSGLGLKT